MGRACALGALAAAGAFGLGTRLEEAAAARPPSPREATIEGEVTAVVAGASGVEVELAGVRRAEAGAGGAVPLRVRLRERTIEGAAGLGALVPGDRLRARVRLRAPEGRANPGGRDRTRELARRGVGATADLVHARLAVRRIDTEESRLLAPLHRFRARAGARLAREGAGAGLVRALALGDRGGLEAVHRDAVQRLGLSHLLSVSGLHLALVGALAFRGAALALRGTLGARASVDPRQPAFALAIAAASAYALLAGWGVPVRRALAMLFAVGLALAGTRPLRRLAPLATAALLVLAAEPAALFDAGAQMSFAATAALVVAAGRARHPTAHSTSARGRLRLALETSAAAGAATAPIAAATFGALSPWGLAANLVAIPWTELALLPSALVASLAAGAAPEAGATALLVRGACALAARSLEAAAASAAVLPPLAAAPPGPLALAAASLAALGVVCARRTGVRVVLAAAIPPLLALAPPRAVEPAPPRVVCLDVGQGDATLVQGRTGALLVDAGVAVPGGPDLGASVVVPALRALGVKRLDLVAASHGDLDHRGGLPAVLRAIPVARVWLPHGAIADPAFSELLAAAHAAGAVLEERGAGSPPLRAGDLDVEALWPPPDAGETSRNDRSLTLRVAVAGHAVLLPGDLEADAERRLLASGAALRADVLKLGHHGSRTSSTAEWLAAVDGEVAVASAPRFGRFGMPHPEAVARARAAGYALWWTGREGAVLIGLEPRLHVRGWRR